MSYLLQHLLRDSASRCPEAPALLHKDRVVSYEALWQRVQYLAGAMQRLGLQTNQRVAVYLPKQPEAVESLFAAITANAVFVPVNPVLKPEQVAYILADCDVSILVTARARADLLAGYLAACPALQHIVLVDEPAAPTETALPTHPIEALIAATVPPTGYRIDADMASILYTSGSTGRPKGVVLSHANMVAGARSVASYLDNRRDDRLLAVLPLSFDYGFSQLSTAFLVGASVVLLDYLLPRDVIRAVSRYRVTGLAAVPTLWNQLAPLQWPEEAVGGLRYLTNSGGSMPSSTIRALRSALPQSRLYLMYGLTEAFRSTFLDPEQLDRRAGSIGKAIPNAEVMVVRPDGSPCDAGETGELVHRGALVARGYWNDAEKTVLRFRPAPGQPEGLVNPEIAVWSGDQVYRDQDGYLYFVGRNDEMIKTSGYRVSPAEIEEVVMAIPGVEQAAAFGVPHPMLGQGIVLALKASCAAESVLAHCRAHLPLYMVPAHMDIRDELPRNANGKIDRARLVVEHQDRFND